MSKLPAPHTVRETTTNRRGGRGKQPFEVSKGVYDLAGIREGKYDHLLGSFHYKKTYSKEQYKNLHPMIKRKKYLSVARNPDGSSKLRREGGRGGGRGGGGTKRAVAAVEAKLAEARKANKELEERLDALEPEEESSNAGNPGLEAHGGTRNRFRKKRP